jgi:RNA polymerase sigma factor (sigma-70 family)
MCQMSDTLRSDLHSMLFCPPFLEDLTDPELLQAFAGDNNQAAFGVLVRRYGPLVLGVCRRVLHNDHDTEDSFQATFLVLARKASSIHKQESLWSWLYKVAYRIALRVRASQARRKLRELQAIQHLTLHQAARPRGPYLGEFLDEEVERLPEKYRAPVLLCYLQGQTNEEAARRLRCPTGTVKIRLLRARQLLRKRLQRRGVTLSLVALAGALVDEAAAAVPPAWELNTVRASIHAKGLSIPAGTGLRVGGLVEASLKRMCLGKLKVAIAVLITVLLCAGTDGLMRPAVASARSLQHLEQRSPAPLPSDLETPLPMDDGRFFAAAAANRFRP